MTQDQIGQFLRDITAWASNQSDIHALALVGSYARNAAKETSDVDLVLVTTRPHLYLNDIGWAHQFGVVEKEQREEYGLLISIRTWYTDGREVEYGITDERWTKVPLDEGTRRVIVDGMRILFERGDILSRHQSMK